MLLLAAAAAALVVVPSAGAKHFEPGDLQVCDAARCVPIVKPEVVALLGPFYYLGGSPAQRPRPALGARYVELRFRNGYVTGIVATRRMDRFLSYGVYLERFRRGTWYAVPRRVAAHLRPVAAGLRPLRLDRAALARSR